MYVSEYDRNNKGLCPGTPECMLNYIVLNTPLASLSPNGMGSFRLDFSMVRNRHLMRRAYVRLRPDSTTVYNTQDNAHPPLGRISILIFSTNGESANLERGVFVVCAPLGF